jgi:hypothetical protein
MGGGGEVEEEVRHGLMKNLTHSDPEHEVVRPPRNLTPNPHRSALRPPSRGRSLPPSTTQAKAIV